MLAQAAPTGSTTWIIVAIVVVLIILAIAAIAARRRRSQALRDRFGPEYARTVRETGSPQQAEAALAAREKHYRSLDIRPLTPGARDRYADSWRAVQAKFVDEPGAAVGDADRLVNDVMRDRGYPVDDPQQRMDDLSVEHAAVLDNYRSATAIAQRNARGEATTEELRQAMLSYRTLFGELLGTDRAAGAGTVEGRIVEPRSTQTTRGTRE